MSALSGIPCAVPLLFGKDIMRHRIVSIDNACNARKYRYFFAFQAVWINAAVKLVRMTSSTPSLDQCIVRIRADCCGCGDPE